MKLYSNGVTLNRTDIQKKISYNDYPLFNFIFLLQNQSVSYFVILYLYNWFFHIQ